MTRLLLTLMGSLLLANTAAGVTVDRFHCQAALVDHDGHVGVVAEGDVSSPRIPALPDPNWVDGIAATEGIVFYGVSDNSSGPELEFSFTLSYTHAFESMSLGNSRASMKGCGYTYEIVVGQSGEGITCATESHPAPWDPTEEWPTVEFPADGVPKFDASRAGMRYLDLAERGHTHPDWAGIRYGCEYLGTVE